MLIVYMVQLKMDNNTVSVSNDEPQRIHRIILFVHNCSVNWPTERFAFNIIGICTQEWQHDFEPNDGASSVELESAMFTLVSK